MNIHKSIFALVLITLSFQSMARSGQKAIYGSFDSKFTSKQSPQHILYMSTGIAYIVPKKNVKKLDKKTNMIVAKPLSDVANLCSYENFSDHRASSPTCTGFLVAPDLVATAGHCVTDKKSCKNLNFVFGVTSAKEFSQGFQIDKTNFYSCKKIITTNQNDRRDYALIKLNKKVQARHIFEIEDDSRLNDESSVYMIGHPLGLPVTYTRAVPVSNYYFNDFFTAPLNSFSGNSGSPVINSSTNKVVGILASGQKDFDEPTDLRSCKTYARYKNGAETITRISLLEDFLKSK